MVARGGPRAAGLRCPARTVGSPFEPDQRNPAADGVHRRAVHGGCSGRRELRREGDVSSSGTGSSSTPFPAYAIYSFLRVTSLRARYRGGRVGGGWRVGVAKRQARPRMAIAKQASTHARSEGLHTRVAMSGGARGERKE